MESLFRNLRTLLLAVALALAVWVSAVTASDPDEMRDFPAPINLQIVGQDPGLVIVGSVPTQVTITLRAPRSVWNQLTGSENQVRAILDLSGLGSGQHQVSIQTQITARPVRVVSVSPQNLQVYLEPLATINLPIQLTLRGEPAIGYEAGSAVLEPSSVVLSGPQSLIQEVTQARAELSIAGLRQDVQGTLPVRLVNASGSTVSGLTAAPEDVQISVPITQQGGYRDIAVKVSIRGQQAGGYRVTNISVYPPVLTVYSKNPALVSDMPGYVETEVFNLNGESENVDTHLKVNLPPGITIVGDQTVQVQIGISPIEGSLSLNGIPIEIIGLSADKEASISPGLVDVILTGPLPVLDKLVPGDIKFFIDLTGLEIGIHQAIPQARILNGNIRVQSLNPGTIEVTISPLSSATPEPSPTPTPTPTPTRTP